MTEEERLSGRLTKASLHSGVYTPLEFQYLLSKSIDLFGLIDCGIALDKTKI